MRVLAGRQSGVLAGPASSDRGEANPFRLTDSEPSVTPSAIDHISPWTRSYGLPQMWQPFNNHAIAHETQQKLACVSCLWGDFDLVLVLVVVLGFPGVEDENEDDDEDDGVNFIGTKFALK